MTLAVANTELVNTFDFWRNRTNELATAMSLYAVTTESNTTTGNAAISGTFTANVLIANSISIGGGNGSINTSVITTTNLTATYLVSNVGNFTNSTITTLSSNSITSNTANLTTIQAVSISTNTLLSNTITVGNATVNVTITSSNSTQQSNGQYYLNANGQWVVLSTITPGSNTQILFNDSNTSNASANFTFNKTTSSLYVSNSISVGSSLLQYFTLTTTGTSQVTLDSFDITAYRSSEYLISIKDNNANNYQLSKILVIHDGGSSYLTEYGVLITNSNIATFASIVYLGNALLQITPTSTNTTIKVSKNMISI